MHLLHERIAPSWYDAMIGISFHNHMHKRTTNVLRLYVFFASVRIDHLFCDTRFEERFTLTALGRCCWLPHERSCDYLVKLSANSAVCWYDHWSMPNGSMHLTVFGHHGPKLSGCGFYCFSWWDGMGETANPIYSVQICVIMPAQVRKVRCSKYSEVSDHSSLPKSSTWVWRENRM